MPQDPKEYWKNIPDNGAQKVKVRRAHSLLFSHLAGGAQVNPSVILMAHDRAFPLQYQMFLNKVIAGRN